MIVVFLYPKFRVQTDGSGFDCSDAIVWK